MENVGSERKRDRERNVGLIRKMYGYKGGDTGRCRKRKVGEEKRVGRGERGKG